MKNEIITQEFDDAKLYQQDLSGSENVVIQTGTLNDINEQKPADLAEILFITSYPPRECGIATYSQDLIKALNNKFSNSLSIKVCALESGKANYYR